MREYELLLELLKLVTASNYHTTDTSSWSQLAWKHAAERRIYICCM